MLFIKIIWDEQSKSVYTIYPALHLDEVKHCPYLQICLVIMMGRSLNVSHIGLYLKENVFFKKSFQEGMDLHA